MDSKLPRGRLYHLIDWEGYSPEEHSWEPAAHVHVPDLVKSFHQDHLDKVGLAATRRKGAPEEGGNIRMQGLEPGSESLGWLVFPRCHQEAMQSHSQGALWILDATVSTTQETQSDNILRPSDWLATLFDTGGYPR